VKARLKDTFLLLVIILGVIAIFIDLIKMVVGIFSLVDFFLMFGSVFSTAWALGNLLYIERGIK
jgi:hypothetical protein